MTTSTNETSAHSMPVQLSQSQVPQQQRHLNPTFIASQPKIRDVKFSPNGGFILYQVTQFYRSTSRPLSTLWLAETNRPSSAIPVTGGEFNDRSGVFHPDGTRILFLSDRQTPGKKVLFINYRLLTIYRRFIGIEAMLMNSTLSIPSIKTHLTSSLMRSSPVPSPNPQPSQNLPS